ncbi:MAG: hypothetical protein BGO30_00755 [Bacteroidetes bacterium 41-46]|nr:MAG: hypothetical protein BGO30_00755 [Bacteroidetes bacterium 41-46]
MKKLLAFSVFLICSSFVLNAQEALKPQMNYVKFNLTSILLKNYSLQYERVLTKRISAAVSFRFMPYTTIPFKTAIMNMADFEDQETIDLFNNAQFGNYAITPEIRFYLGKKGYGRGFYIAPYYRYAAYDTQNLEFNFNTGDDQNPQNQKVDLKGSITSHTGGIMFGVQWALGKHISLDWWILGAAYGVSSGVLNGVPTPAIPESDLADVKREIEDMDIPMVKKTATVTSNSVRVDLTGPWAGIRSGIVFGVKF